MQITRTLLLLACLVLTSHAQANGRQPCDRGAGGVSHCANGKFVCNNGTVSRSKKVCGAGNMGSRGNYSLNATPSRSRSGTSSTRRQSSRDTTIIERRTVRRDGAVIERPY